MNDFFFAIENFPGYRVSRTGQVHSCWSRHARPAAMTASWHPLRPIQRQGYPSVNLSRGGKKTAVRIHRLVLEAFVGPCPEGMVGCHNDGDRANNRVDNLRWDSPKANSDDALRHGTRARGSRCNSKLVEDEVSEIRRLRAEGESLRDLSSRFGVTAENILAIVHRRTWRHLPEGNVGERMKGLADLEGREPRPVEAA